MWSGKEILSSFTSPTSTELGLNKDYGFVLLVGLLLLSLLLLLRNWALGDAKSGKFPPGPFALPIIGHLHLLAAGLPQHQVFAKLSLKYGDLVGLWLGRQRCVVVSSPVLAKEFLTTHDKIFANRPQYKFTHVQLYGPENDMFFASYGAPWRKRRKICTLELFTAKRLQELEYVRQEEVGFLLDRIAQGSQGGSIAVNIRKSISEMSTNLICRLLYSRPRTPTGVESVNRDEDLPQLIHDMEHETSASFGDLIPWLSIFDTMRKRRMRNNHDRLDRVITDILTKREGAIMQNEAPKDDFLHALLSKKEVAETSGDADALTMDELKGIILGVLGGSIHTTALTLEWAMAELLKHPHCLTKMQREMETVLDKKKKEQIMDADVAKLSYLRCVMKEVMRLHPVAPLLLPHTSSEECKVLNYSIPKKTHVLVNVWAIGRDERVWANATLFVPERFEGTNSRVDVKGQNFELLPFGTGRRICLGLPLALPILEVTLANLVNRFDWELPEGQTCAGLNMDEHSGVKALPLLGVPKPRI